MTDEARTRAYSWSDPARTAASARSTSGLEFFRSVLRGEELLAPIGATMDFRLAEVEEGRVTFRCRPSEFHYNPIGVVHGSLACALLDSAMGCSVHSTLPAGDAYTTLELKVNLLRAMTAETGEVVAAGRVISSGRRVALAEADVRDGQGRVLAHATSTCLIMRQE